MKLAERVEAIRCAIEMFPRCTKCGLDLSAERLSDLVIHPDRPNRFAHRDCLAAQALEADHAAD